MMYVYLNNKHTN